MITIVSEENVYDAAAVYMKSWRESHSDICSAEFIEKHDLQYMINYLTEKKDHGYDIFIDYNSEKPVGLVGINPADDEICLLYILPEEQGKGFGTELLKFALSRCKNPYVTVLDTNTKAAEFYKKRGFVPAKEQPERAENKRIFERKYVYQK